MMGDHGSHRILPKLGIVCLEVYACVFQNTSPQRQQRLVCTFPAWACSLGPRPDREVGVHIFPSHAIFTTISSLEYSQQQAVVPPPRALAFRE